MVTSYILFEERNNRQEFKNQQHWSIFLGRNETLPIENAIINTLVTIDSNLVISFGFLILLPNIP